LIWLSASDILHGKQIREPVMTRIIIIRHGQTKWNEGEGERFRGRANLDLDERGIRQAKATAARIAQWQVARVYSSPLKRSIRTAQILARPFGLEAQPLDGLIDIDFGTWQGLPLTEVAAQDGTLYSLWLRSPHLVTFPQGESLDQVRKRVVTTFENLLPQHQGQTIGLVSHKVACKVLLCALLGLDNSHFWQVEQDTCAINLVEVRDKAKAVVLLNDTSHLINL
jgi:broad specificity phosphatase PhoE